MANSVENIPTTPSLGLAADYTGVCNRPPKAQLEDIFLSFKSVVDNHLSLDIIRDLIEHLERTRKYVDDTLQRGRLQQVEPCFASQPQLQPNVQPPALEDEPVTKNPPSTTASEPVPDSPPVEEGVKESAEHTPTSRRTRKKPAKVPVEEYTPSAELTGYGLKTRDQFRAQFLRVKHRVYDKLLQKLGTAIYPSVCPRPYCTLCLSWYLYTAVTPCHKKYACTPTSCYYGYNSHTTVNGLRMLKKYHSRVHHFPIHVCEQPSGPEYENSLSETSEFVQYWHSQKPEIQKIIRAIGDMNAIAKDIRENTSFVECSSGSESDDATVSVPLKSCDPARKRKKPASISGSTSVVSRRRAKQQ